MEIQFDHIARGEGVLWQGRPEQFVDDSFSCHPNGTFLLSGGMRSHNHPAGGSFGSHRDLGPIIKAAFQLTFGTLLNLIRWEMQTSLNQRVIKQAIVLSARDKGK